MVNSHTSSGSAHDRRDDSPRGPSWWYWAMLLASAVFNDLLLGWLTYQGPSRGARALITTAAGLLEVALTSGLMKLSGRYKHRWVLLALITLAVMMLAVGIIMMFWALMTAPPDNS